MKGLRRYKHSQPFSWASCGACARRLRFWPWELFNVKTTIL